MKQAFLKMHLAVLLWGFSGIFGRAISLSAPVLVWYRLLLAALFLGGILLLKKKWQNIQRKDIYKLIGIGTLVAIHWLFFYGCIKLANVSVAVICLATAGVFVSLLEPLINKGKLNKTELFLGFLAVIGVVCIYFFQPAKTSAQKALTPMKNFDLGLILGLLASILSAVFTILNKPLAEKYDARPLVFWEMTSGFGFLTLLLPLFLYYSPDAQFLPVGWDYLWIFLLAYCCTVWGQSLAMSALKYLSAFTTTLTVNLEPVYGIILAFIIFNENQQLGSGFYIGMSLIFLTVLLQIYLTQRAKKKALKAN